MNYYEIKIKHAGLTYHVEPFFDDDELFVVIHKVEGLEQFGPDELPALFDEGAHVELAKLLGEVLRKEAEEV